MTATRVGERSPRWPEGLVRRRSGDVDRHLRTCRCSERIGDGVRQDLRRSDRRDRRVTTSDVRRYA